MRKKSRWLALVGYIVAVATVGAIPASATRGAHHHRHHHHHAASHGHAEQPKRDGAPKTAAPAAKAAAAKPSASSKSTTGKPSTASDPSLSSSSSTGRAGGSAGNGDSANGNSAGGNGKTAAAEAALYSNYTQMSHEYTFGGSSLDESVWSIYNSSHTDANARQRGLISVSDGQLHLGTVNQAGSGMCLCRSTKPTGPYGRYDIRARASANSDHGFAILLWPNAGHWPEAGEIDIAEYDGLRNKLYTTVHYDTTNRRQIHATLGDFTQWHTYSVVWTPTKIDYLLDGNVVMTVTDSGAIPRDALHLVLQAGANHPGRASNTSSVLDVDWIRQYSSNQ